ncbi:phage infection protein [Pseudomonas sp. Q11]|uniref:phage infection protein n=1 Tax=Pseudomonas sp. Q11 TaxID=2968470 RepID=UPI00210C91B8|nr:phage infection protein [Pseudomonas sp. Q11]MCQ6258633.1 phage infection protein [Pseudomonas sp. Q11]
MFNLSKVSSLAIALALVGGLGLSNVASATAMSAAAKGQAAQLLVEGGSDRLSQNRVAEGGSDRLLQNRVAEGGSDRLLQNRVAEGGADRLQELRERNA